MTYRTYLSFLFTLSISIPVMADATEGYYSKAEGKTGQALLAALHDIVGKHNTVSYSKLWDVYQTSDIYPDGKFWDMYSTKHWNTTGERCGDYKYVGDCINREHSFPKSWFNDASPMYSDAYHIYPTDGKVNGQRLNFPYGECSNGTTLPSSGNIKPLGRLGNSTFTGYSGKVFEPDDQYKGDFARSYFYMAAAYYDRIAGWKSDMLAGNSYPAFSKWSVDLLMKWHRQDEVSEKETTRNDAVSRHQTNRNPFIDHPELAEFIWGSKVGTPWYPGTTGASAIVTPADGSTIDMGLASTGRPRSIDISVKGTALEDDVTAYVTPAANFSISPNTLKKEAVNNGTASVTLTFSSDVTGSFTGHLILRSASLSSSVNVMATAVNGIPAQPATSITSESFVASWINISGENDIYTLHVEQNGSSIDNFPREVEANAQSCLVDGLEHSTAYVYYLTSGDLHSNHVSVTTAGLQPVITLTPNGSTEFESTAGYPSEPLEIFADIENIEGNIKFTVKEPFQLSTDKTSWSSELILVPGEDRFYIRLFSTTAGSFKTILAASADGYFNDDFEVTGVVSKATGTFLEDFEANNKDNYTNGVYEGSAAMWNCRNVGVYNSDSKYANSGVLCARFGKNSDSSLEMAENKTRGAATVSFQARNWTNDGTSTIEVEYSTDNGQSWNSCGSAKVDSENYTGFSYRPNIAGNVRIRLRQTSGKRILVDDIEITDHSSSVTPPEFNTWDAYCLNGNLVIENSVDKASAAVYSTDGMCRYSSSLKNETVTLTLAPGLYIVVVNDFARRVVVK